MSFVVSCMLSITPTLQYIRGGLVYDFTKRSHDISYSIILFHEVIKRNHNIPDEKHTR